MKTPLLLGHRGAKAVSPENTRASLRRAIADGAHGFEFDVRVTVDNACVLLHDETLDRTTNGKGRLRDHRLEDVLRLDAASWYSLDHPMERVPTLEDVLDEFFGKVPLALEMKETLPEAGLADVARRLRESRDAFLVMASFQVEPLESARDLVPAAPRARILRKGESLPGEDQLSGIGLWGVFARHESIDERFLADARRAGLRCVAYTVNDPERAALLRRWGVDGIISDDPAAVRPAIT